MCQETMRGKCRNIMTRYGSPQTFFTKKLKVSRTHFSMWLAGERELGQKRLYQLDKILAQV